MNLERKSSRKRQKSFLILETLVLELLTHVMNKVGTFWGDSPGQMS